MSSFANAPVPPPDAVAPASTAGAWPPAGGECGGLIRSRAWQDTPLGGLEDWPVTLRTTVSNIVNSPVPKVLVWGPAQITLYNDAYRALLGDRHPQALGSPAQSVWSDSWDWHGDALSRCRQGEIVCFRERPMTLLRDGEASPSPSVLDLFYTPVFAAADAVEGVMCTVVDVTQRASQADALRVSNRRFRTAMDAVHGVLWTNSADGRMTGDQPGWAALTGQTPAEYEGYGWAQALHPDDAQGAIAAWNAAVASRSMFIHEHRVRRRDGAWRNFAVRGLPMLRADGSIEEWVGVHTDITEQRAAERSLLAQATALAAEVRQRERAEEQLRTLNENLEARVIAEIEERHRAEAKLAQAQKLESIGKLTGGIAHDFNNLLQVISGSLHLLSKDIAGNDRAERLVGNALAGVSRGAKLASQLLAFGRRQPLEPRVVNATRMVQGMDDMLRRAIGGAVEIETVIGGGLWNTFVDPNQIENAVLNLAINARDAMNGSGRLTIELANVHLDEDYARRHDEVSPGQYVMLAVSDTGCGMPAEVIARAFDPFFSTKPEGKGSGLGLSMVYGFVKQSNGHIKIYSEVGHGTTVKLFLPRAMQAEDMPVRQDAGTVTGGDEVILVVEDDAEVREVVVAMLSDLGYRVLQASDAAKGLAVIESGIPVDLLFTDVVMPGSLKSPEMARQARLRIPHLAVLFTSGYTENSIVHGGRLDAGVELLSKPYSREALARKVRHLLGNRAQRQAAQAGAAPAAATVAPAAASAAPSPAASPAAHTGAGVVLFVEDDPLIRVTSAAMLLDAGYTVIEAGNAEEATCLARRHRPQVVVTDINLPGASGTELAAQLRGEDPSLVVIFASGEASPLPRGELSGSLILGKPYTSADLVAAVQSALQPRQEKRG
ncbi:response regulator [Pseudacidovorax intermedius]|uniref:response regulator n=1 Tax=Pseudacidovorax intermedius TaxID=433924 RepID=UPI0009E7CAC2|nr:response regulator [Pseudacidovorax intermedius]